MIDEKGASINTKNPTTAHRNKKKIINSITLFSVCARYSLNEETTTNTETSILDINVKKVK